MTSAYKILFAIELKHEYYADGKCNDISLVPSQETIALLKNSRILYKMVGNIFLGLIKVKDKNSGADADKPMVPLRPNGKFVFYLRLEKPVFTTITNLDNELLRDKRFYFSNIFETKINTQLYLSGPISNYDSAAGYIPGDMVKNAAGETFECIKSTTGNDTTDAGFWFDHGNNTYPTKNDMYLFLPRVSTFTAKTEAKVFDIKLFAFDAATKSFDLSDCVKEIIVNAGKEATKNVGVDLQNLPEGKYVIKINGEDYEGGTDASGNPIPFYLSNEIVFNNYFGVIEIFNYVPADPSFSLLDADGKVKNKSDGGGESTWLNYIINFASKMATWKYVAAEGKVSSINDETTGYVFNKTHADQQDIFLSNAPIRLQENPVIFDLILTKAITSQPPPAPNPNPQITGLISRLDNDYFCTINLNY